MAQLVRRLTLGSGHGLMVCEFEPHVGLGAAGVEPAWDSLSLPLSLPLPCSLSFSLYLKINKLKKIFFKVRTSKAAQVCLGYGDRKLNTDESLSQEPQPLISPIMTLVQLMTDIHQSDQ